MSSKKYTIEEILVKNGQYLAPTVGVSMLPMLKEGRDTVVIKPKTERLQPLDVALYRSGEKYLLHRVLAQTEGGYIIRGDNCYEDENVPEEAVFGVLTEFFRKDKHIFCSDERYLRYVKRHLKTYKFRRIFYKIKRFIKKILKALKVKK